MVFPRGGSNIHQLKQCYDARANDDRLWLVSKDVSSIMSVKANWPIVIIE